MRPIDADALTNKYGDWYTEEGTEEGFIGNLKQLIDEQPTIDAVPVTHCKDCKFWRTYAYVNGRPKFLPKCGYNQIYVNGEDFCSRAERRENDKR